MARRAIVAIIAGPKRIHIESYFRSGCTRDFLEDKGYLECQHRDPSGTLNHCKTLGSEKKDKCLRGGLEMEFGYGTEKASYLSPWDLCGGALSVSSLRDQDFMKTVLGLLSAIHQLHHGGGDFASML
jgi:hypothetical protein